MKNKASRLSVSSSLIPTSSVALTTVLITTKPIAGLPTRYSDSKNDFVFSVDMDHVQPIR